MVAEKLNEKTNSMLLVFSFSFSVFGYVRHILGAREDLITHRIVPYVYQCYQNATISLHPLVFRVFSSPRKPMNMFRPFKRTYSRNMSASARREVDYVLF